VRTRDVTNGFVERLVAEQYGTLLAFFRRRSRLAADAADLAQEVYLRMLRVNNPESIRNPQAYLFTVANNLAIEQGALNGRRANAVPVDEASAEPQLHALVAFDDDIDLQRRVARLSAVLMQLPPKCQQVVSLQYQQGLNHEQVAERLGVSTHMVKKYLAQALVLCRKRMRRLA
jgi:RNA polymerase sigma-70 factor (ECF subfamily)